MTISRAAIHKGITTSKPSTAIGQVCVCIIVIIFPILVTTTDTNTHWVFFQIGINLPIHTRNHFNRRNFSDKFSKSWMLIVCHITVRTIIFIVITFDDFIFEIVLIGIMSCHPKINILITYIMRNTD